MAVLAGCSSNNGSTATHPPTSSGAPSSTSSSAGSGGAAQTVASTGKPLGSLKVGGKAVCAVCSVKEGTKNEEEVKATLDYKGKTYGFCNESEKAEFISDPAKYASK
jgi:YHS domain-containing protein